MKKKGFSIMEVVISVSIMALILSTLGLSFLASERLRLNARINNEVQRIGEGILDYLFTLPITDEYVTISGNTLSLIDLNNSPQDRIQILTNVDNILTDLARSQGFQVVSVQNPNNITSKKGAIATFTNNASTILFQGNAGLYTITLQIRYISPNRRQRIITVSRIIVP